MTLTQIQEVTTKMAEEDTTEDLAGTYRFDGRKDGMPVGRVVLKGTTDNPEDFVDKGGITDLTEDQLSNLRNIGLKLTKLTDEEAAKAKQAQIDSVSSAATKRGADQLDPGAVLAAKKFAAQQKAATTPATPESPQGDGDKGKTDDEIAAEAAAADKAETSGTTGSGSSSSDTKSTGTGKSSSGAKS